MKLLPDSFEKKGFLHRLEWREGNVAIYRRHKPDGTRQLRLGLRGSWEAQ